MLRKLDFEHGLDLLRLGSGRLAGGAGAEIDDWLLLFRKCFREFLDWTFRPENNFAGLVNRMSGAEQFTSSGAIPNDGHTFWFFEVEIQGQEHMVHGLWKLLHPLR